MSEGVQIRLPQDVLLWHVDYFKVKTVKTLWTQEKLLPFFSEPLMHVGSLTITCMQGSHIYVCVEFGYFLLFICLMPTDC